MRQIRFERADLVKLHLQSAEAKHDIYKLARRKVRELKLKPPRKAHAVKFGDDELYTDDGRLISSSMNMRSVIDFIQNVCAIPKDWAEDNENTLYLKAAQKRLCEIYLLCRP